MTESTISHLPLFVRRLDQWVMRVCLSVFLSALLLNVMLTPTGKWLPYACGSVFMGVACYYMCRVVVRFHLWVRNSYMTQSRVRRYLIFVLGLSGVVYALLLVPLVLNPRANLVIVLGITLPTGFAMSAIRLWKELPEFPAPKH